MRNLNLEINDNIAILEFDQPDSKVNVLGRESMSELDKTLNQLSEKSELKALIISSRKKGIFIAGADIKEIEHIKELSEAKAKADHGKRVFDKLEKLNVITVAAINGVCLGGGLELALACKYRVSTFSEKVKIGLPEVNLGIIPGWGGTQRLPRAIGLVAAMNMILAGKLISAKQALKYGLVDRLFPEVSLIDATLEFVQELTKVKIHLRKRKKSLTSKFLENTPCGRALTFSQARKNILKKTKGFYPAPLKALDVIKRSYGGNIEKGARLESEVFAELVLTDVSKNLIQLFYLNEEFKKLSWVDEKIKPRAVNKCGILGAGVMGGGIAQLVSDHDIAVRLKDISYKALGQALKTASGVFTHALKRRKLKKYQVSYKMGLISPTTSYSGFGNADLIIEAVVENLDIKKKVFSELAGVTAPGVVLASNTSALPIIEMAKASGIPKQVAGLHFFNPVHRMPLVEIIRSRETSDQTLATLIGFARKIGKLVIVVNDVPGFLINRILIAYLIEAAFLLEEGIKISRIDKIARDFGMPMGPIELVDEIGIDVGYKVVKILGDAYGARMRMPSVLMKAKEEKLLGKKAKLGFYIYRGKKKIPNPKICKLISNVKPKTISDDVVLKRIIYVMINEAARCLDEKVIQRPETVDIGMIMGTGFAPFRGGLLRYADALGVNNVVSELNRLAREFSVDRFTPCEYLVKMAKNNEKFYSKGVKNESF